ncbi:glutathione S-transferase [Rhizoctonia solani]|nr:glutathione S-transferase [Rhizoctonia solani]
MAQPLTLYSAEVCPFAQRTVIALQEAKADYTTYEIDLSNKPEWYAPKVNPASKVPAIAYGGPQVDPSNPSPESAKLTESLVLLEFIADLYPTSGLLSSDPVERAQSRFIIDLVSNKVLPGLFAVTWRGESPERLYDGLLAFQAQLESHARPFLGGDGLNIADAAVAPFLARLEAQLRRDVGGFATGEGPKIHDEIFKSERFGTLSKYTRALLARETVKKSFPEDKYLEQIKIRIQNSLKEKASA